MWKPYSIIDTDYAMILKNENGYYISGSMNGGKFEIDFNLISNNPYKFGRFYSMEPITVEQQLENADMIEAAMKACKENEHYLDMLGKDLG